MIRTSPASYIRVLITLLWLYASFAVAQPGFLSIDCGSVVNYTDPFTGIEWVTDEGYIRTGINTETPNANKSSPSNTNATQLLDHRSFPEGKKNCYILPTEANSSYLVRIGFKYLTIIPLLENLSFSIYIDSTLWYHVSYGYGPGSGGSDVDSEELSEALVVSQGMEIRICLVREQGNPFISSLELRKLDPGMYERNDTGLFYGKYLILGYRYNFGVIEGPVVRYPDDLYDRYWYPYTNSPSPVCPTTLRSSIVDLPDAISLNKPPKKVMEDACVATAGIQNLSLTFNFDRTVTDSYGVLYLQEIDANASESNQRAVRIGRNVPSCSKCEVYHNVTLSTDDDASISYNVLDFIFKVVISKAPYSQLEPLVNAAEFYYQINVSTAITYPEDSKALELVIARSSLSGYSGDPCFPVEEEWVACDNSLSPARITSLNLTNFDLEGFLDPAIAELTELTELILDKNKLTGPIPSLRPLTKLKLLIMANNNFVGDFPNYLLQSKSLEELSVANNNLTGPISDCPPNQLQTVQCQDNPLLECEEWTEKCQDSNASGLNIAGVLGGVVAGTVVLAVAFVLLLLRKRRRVKAKKRKLIGSRSNNPFNRSGERNSSASFTFREVLTMTRNLERKIGQGSYGAVYLGELSSGQKVAVKVHDSTSGQGRVEFVNEVTLLTRVHHKNLVSLLGYCEESGEQILIYDYMAKGNLREHLYGDNFEPLDWRTRLDIAINAGKGLEYLHKDCHPQIIHRDVKTSNILLDEELVAKVADFGLSKAGPDGGINDGGISTFVKGTFGYLDPEYFMTQRLTYKSDVYSFGIVLLEIVTGIPPYNSLLPDGSRGTLLEWVVKQQSLGNVMQIVDSNLEGKYENEAVGKVIELALSCIEVISVDRPDMQQVVRVLSDAYYLEFPGEYVKTFSAQSAAFAGTSPTSYFDFDALLSSGTPHSSMVPNSQQFSKQVSSVDSPPIDASYKAGR